MNMISYKLLVAVSPDDLQLRFSWGHYPRCTLPNIPRLLASSTNTDSLFILFLKFFNAQLHVLYCCNIAFSCFVNIHVAATAALLTVFSAHRCNYANVC